MRTRTAAKPQEGAVLPWWVFSAQCRAVQSRSCPGPCLSNNLALTSGLTSILWVLLHRLMAISQQNNTAFIGLSIKRLIWNILRDDELQRGVWFPKTRNHHPFRAVTDSGFRKTSPGKRQSSRMLQHEFSPVRQEMCRYKYSAGINTLLRAGKECPKLSWV